MITTADVLTGAPQSRAVPVEKDPPLSNADQAIHDYLDGTIEAAVHEEVRKCDVDGLPLAGLMFEIKVPTDFAAPVVIRAVRKLWEGGDWSVGVFAVHNDAGEMVAAQMVFALPRGCADLGSVDHDADFVYGARRFRREEILSHEEIATAFTEAGMCSQGLTVRAVFPTKPRVVLIGDTPNWAYDHKFKTLAEYLRDEFEFNFFYTENWFKGHRPRWNYFDIIYEAHHRNPAMGIPMDRALGALRSQWFKAELPGPPDSDDIALVNRYRAFEVLTQKAYDGLKDHCPNLVRLTSPVDMRRFPEATPPRSRIVAEWNGNAKHRKAGGAAIKHFEDIVVPACELAGVELISAQYGVEEGPTRQRSAVEMPVFYMNANVALCASEYEGSSNSVREAMAAGLAVIATDVGDHRELMESQMAHFGGETGIILVERSVAQFAHVLRSLTPEVAHLMGRINRAEIEERWDWRRWAPRFADFLRRAL